MGILFGGSRHFLHQMVASHFSFRSVFALPNFKMFFFLFREEQSTGEGTEMYDVD